MAKSNIPSAVENTGEYNSFGMFGMFLIVPRRTCLSKIREENEIIIVSGCASGADAIGERYAKENGWRKTETM